LALGKTVAELKGTMTAPEFNAWVEFYKDFPFDDFHRYHKPALVASGRFFNEANDMLDYLQKPQVDEELTDVDMSFLKLFGVR